MKNLQFKYWDAPGTVKQIIDSWSPADLKYEKEYEESLHNHLAKHFDGLEITRQFSIGRSKADIVIENKFVIEIKKDFRTKSEYQRLLGQIIDYRKWAKHVVLLFVGEVDSNLLTSLKKHLVEMGMIDSMIDEVSIVMKK